jgi:uncharacterized Tic20 family protein
MQPTPPPGWYVDSGGTQRWWDGSAWGPAAPSQTTEEQGRLLSLLCHLSVMIAAILFPLIIRQTEGKKNAFVRHHATEALNFHLTFLCAWFSGFAVMAATTIGAPADSFPVLSFVVFALMFVMFFCAVGLGVLASVRASQERWWRYPVSIRFVPGSQHR